ncbi:hypothetical protein FSARC_5276 [Fusarium sarcochroum]|uniref:BZIP domain-containing protein n=1 Tax=Fusarium sarcochroum TaxID=1208366 RepID=A0A8H4XAE1_9HYPO|nr:hypothetical protein FSARC_5276 [Fusarium sarcochroum]
MLRPRLKRKRGMECSFPETDGEQALLALPGAREPITVHMEYSTGSNRAASKRAKNAEASVRHRRKKAAKDQHDAEELQWYRVNWPIMKARNGDLEQQLDACCQERDNLKRRLEQQPSTGDVPVDHGDGSTLGKRLAKRVRLGEGFDYAQSH